MKTVIIHGKRLDKGAWGAQGPWSSPRDGRPECDLWGVTRANCRFWHNKLTDWTAWFDTHPLTKSGRFEGITVRRPDAWKWYCAQDGTRPIYLQAPEAHVPEHQAEALRLFNMVPGAVRFPMREIQRAFPIYEGTYPNLEPKPNRWFVEMAGSLIAKAIMDGYECIILNGIGCWSGYEEQVAHRSILYWIAWAHARGIHVLVEGQSCFRTPAQIYAYEKFNYEEYEAAKREATLKHDWISQDEQNRKEQARGRPIRHRIPVLDV